MKRSLIFTVTLLILANIAYSHESNKAFFKITQEKEFVSVEAEFPWALRNALIKFNPKLKNAKSKDEFTKTLKAYFSSNLVFTSPNGSSLKLVEIKEIPSNGHSHQSNFIALYDGVEFMKMTNSLMFNLNKNQKNYHEIFLDEDILEFTTFKGNNEIKIDSKKTHIYWFLLIPILMTISFFVFRKAKN